MVPRVLLPCDTFERNNYIWHGAITQYIRAVVEPAGAVPLLLPSLGEDTNWESILDITHGVCLTGSRSNVHPSLYETVPEEKYEPYDEDRDSTTLPLIKAVLERGIPLLAICRGFQELNVALGGTLATEIQEIEGNLDHRADYTRSPDDRFDLAHKIRVTPGGCLANIVQDDEIEVNSLHRQAVLNLAPALQVEARAPDGVIEAVSVKGAPGFALGVQWHPEYLVASDHPSKKIFTEFGNAVRSYARTS